MQIHDLRPPKGARHARKRLGCGTGSGHGKTSGRGHKGQKARAGGFVRAGFEGGQMPLYRRLPRRGFNHSALAVVYDVVNVGSLSVFGDKASVTPDMLEKAGLVRGTRDVRIKMLGDGELKKALTVSAHKFSASAKQKIEAAGGTCMVIPVGTTKEPAQA